MRNALRIFIPTILLSILLFSCQKDRIKRSEIEDSAINLSQDSCFIFLPNAFSPNGDGKNDILRPIVKNINTNGFDYTIRSYDKTVLFNTTQLSGFWDGGDYPTGRYIATVKGTYISGGQFEQSSYVCLYTDCVSYNNINNLEFESMFDFPTRTSIYPSGEKMCN